MPAIRLRTCLRTTLALLLLSGLPTSTARAACDSDPGGDPVVEMKTRLGSICLRLFPGTAPGNVANFLDRVDLGDYDASLVHRVAPNFVIQGGAYFVDEGLYQKLPTRSTVTGEPSLSNLRGTLALALSGNPPNPNSGTSQWFINLKDNSGLDGDFTVFGEVASGMAVVDAIGAFPNSQAQVISLLDAPATILSVMFTFGLPLENGMPGFTGCFDPDIAGAQADPVEDVIVRDPVTDRPIWISKACIGAMTSGTCTDPDVRVLDFTLGFGVDQPPVVDEMSCDEVEASDASLGAWRAAVEAELPILTRVARVPEPAPAAAGAAAAAALAALRGRRRPVRRQEIPDPPSR